MKGIRAAAPALCLVCYLMQEREFMWMWAITWTKVDFCSEASKWCKYSMQMRARMCVCACVGFAWVCSSTTGGRKGRRREMRPGGGSLVLSLIKQRTRGLEGECSTRTHTNPHTHQGRNRSLPELSSGHVTPPWFHLAAFTEQHRGVTFTKLILVLFLRKKQLLSCPAKKNKKQCTYQILCHYKD